ncbi:Rap guanine nucleotide exchange factor [Echinococcus granulosus]|uniref:Rap guanine nucleotide exchange factor n=1 Tax=Echinococcus granulosus TaxID=6210 RepID=W6U8I0_ECHGR|nr:Rap guanine nucleotide exchange factor [Echinococcus granulosus]EUB56706.1 Rap guanine nucleotide exchange factor [Echinococcus granulosus]
MCTVRINKFLKREHTMATLNISAARSNPPGGESAPSNVMMRLSEETQSPLVLPSVEQMRRDVANATCELQQAFFQTHNPKCTQGNELGRKHLIEVPFSSEPNVLRLREAQNDSTADPFHRTQEETVCEELIINGKKYRQTFQKRVIFMLPASGETENTGNRELPEKYVSANFDQYNRVFEDNGARLDLQVQNQEGGFSPRLVIAAQRESPEGKTHLSPSNVYCQGDGGSEQREICSPRVDSATTLMTKIISHMYHFGHWDKTASILDPRLPASLSSPFEVSGLDDSIFCVTPAEWHHSDITYGREAAGAAGTTAKARIVACLQKFTQRSAQTGKQLYRSTYVQHTKIARWRSSEKSCEIPPSCTITNDQSGVPKTPARSQDNLLHFVANVSEVWKQVARSPLGGEEEAVISFPPLHLCSYDRLQLLQSLCPAAAAAIMILGRQMPEMRSDSCITPPNQLPRSTSTVTADAWCPRALMIMDSPEESLLFSMPDGFEIGSTLRKRNCLLRGGTLDGLLVYALKIFRQNKSDTYESLIPNIFMRLYPTFTIANEVVSRLIQRYLAFVPIEPGGLGCISEKGEAVEPGRDWNEAVNTLEFLLKLLTRTERVLYDAKLENKIFRFAQLLKMDSRLVGSLSPRNHSTVDDDIDKDGEEDTLSNIPNGSLVKLAKQKSAISDELTRIAESLLDLVPTAVGRRRFTEEVNTEQPAKEKVGSEINFLTCTCYQRLSQFLRFKVNALAKQITSMEEMCFDGIQLYELISIKDLEKGNTPTLSRCIQHFNDLNSMVKCLTRIAKELGEPLSKVQSDSGECDTCVDETLQEINTPDHLCPLCGLQREALIQQRLMEDNLQRVSKKFAESRGASLKSYLCLSSVSYSLPLRMKRSNVLLENTLVHLCDLAQELKKINNFSSFLAVILGLQNAPTQSVSKRLKLRLTKLGAYMLPPSFSAYRRDLEAAKMPCLPYLGLVFQQLIHLDNGNVLFLSSPSGGETTSTSHTNQGLITGDEVDANKIVNFWRCWKHYLILGYFMKRADRDMLEKDEKGSYEIEPDTEIQSYLKSFKMYSTHFHRRVDTTASEQSSLRCNRRKQCTKSDNFHTLP